MKERKHGEKPTYFGANVIVSSSNPDAIHQPETYLSQAQSPCRKHLYSSNYVWTTHSSIAFGNTLYLFLAFTSSFAGLTNCSLSSLSSITIFCFFYTACDRSNWAVMMMMEAPEQNSKQLAHVMLNTLYYLSLSQTVMLSVVRNADLGHAWFSKPRKRLLWDSIIAGSCTRKRAFRGLLSGSTLRV